MKILQLFCTLWHFVTPTRKQSVYRSWMLLKTIWVLVFSFMYLVLVDAMDWSVVLKLPCWWSIWLQNLLFFNPWWTSFTTFASGGLSGGLVWGLFRGLCWFSMFFIRTWVFRPVSFGLFSMFGFGFLQSDPKLKIPFRNSWFYWV